MPDKLNSIKVKSFCSAGTVKTIKRQTIDWEKILNDLYPE